MKEIFNKFTFKNGFIDSKALLPIDFCLFGIERYIKDLEFFNVYGEINEQLKTRLSEEEFRIYLTILNYQA